MFNACGTAISEHVQRMSCYTSRSRAGRIEVWALKTQLKSFDFEQFNKRLLELSEQLSELYKCIIFFIKHMSNLVSYHSS